jgi:hypothetical protein
MMMEGLTPKVISNPFIDKLLNQAVLSNLQAILFSIPGHLFYILQYDPSLPALVFDFTTQDWYEWTDANSNAYTFAAAIGVTDSSGSDPGTLTLDPSLGTIYSITPTVNSDVAGNFPVTLITRKVDLQTNLRKFWKQLTVIGDRNTGTPAISWTDDDYQSYNTPRTVDMSTARPTLFRLGNGRRRAYKYTQSDNNPMRLEALEAQFDQGQA